MTAAAVLDVARAEIGTVENPPNSNRQPYGKAYGWDGQYWCMQFVWWALTQAGEAAAVPKTASTVAAREWYRARKLWLDGPNAAARPGDLVFFKFPGNSNVVNHVGIVEAVEPGGNLICIEGNTAGTNTADQRNGGGVWRKRRTRANVVGFARPAYAQPPAPAPLPLEDLVQCFDWPAGTSHHKLVCPVGKASQVTKEAWFSMACDGEITSFAVWFQGDQGGISEYRGRVDKDRRAWWKLPDGCTQVVAHIAATGPVGAALELLPK